MFQITNILNNSHANVKKLDDEDLDYNKEQPFFIQENITHKKKAQIPYPLIITQFSIPDVNNNLPEIIWPRRLHLNQYPKQIISIRLQIPSSASSGTYFRILFSSHAEINSNSVELIFDTSKGFLLHQLVNF